jgi:hypothetical protein
LCRGKSARRKQPQSYQENDNALRNINRNLSSKYSDPDCDCPVSRPV